MLYIAKLGVAQIALLKCARLISSGCGVYEIIPICLLLTGWKKVRAFLKMFARTSGSSFASLYLPGLPPPSGHFPLGGCGF